MHKYLATDLQEEKKGVSMLELLYKCAEWITCELVIKLCCQIYEDELNNITKNLPNGL